MADVVAKVTGVANGMIRFELLGQPANARTATCKVADVQQSLGRTVEAGDHVRFVGAALVMAAASFAAWGVPTEFLIGADGRYSRT